MIVFHGHLVDLPAVNLLDFGASLCFHISLWQSQLSVLPAVQEILLVFLKLRVYVTSPVLIWILGKNKTNLHDLLCLSSILVLLLWWGLVSYSCPWTEALLFLHPSVPPSTLEV